jgi:hypothetical protein
MAIMLTEADLITLQSMREQVTPGNYWQIYEWLADTLESRGVERIVGWGDDRSPKVYPAVARLGFVPHPGLRSYLS